jgi:hypothetical protein
VLIFISQKSSLTHLAHFTTAQVASFATDSARVLVLKFLR